jgi:hypothetical protein
MKWSDPGMSSAILSSVQKYITVTHHNLITFYFSFSFDMQID